MTKKGSQNCFQPTLSRGVNPRVKRYHTVKLVMASTLLLSCLAFMHWITRWGLSLTTSSSSSRLHGKALVGKAVVGDDSGDSDRVAVLTSWFSYEGDPQRGSRVDSSSIEYIRNLYVSATALGLPLIVFHDRHLDERVVKSYSRRGGGGGHGGGSVAFVRVDEPPQADNRRSTNDHRFFVYDSFLRGEVVIPESGGDSSVVSGPDLDRVLIVDASDVFFARDPFAYMRRFGNSSRLFLAHDDGYFHPTAWSAETCYPTVRLEWKGSTKQMYNAGAFGGTAGPIKCIVRCIADQLASVTYGKGNCNMPAFNWCVHYGKCTPGDGSEIVDKGSATEGHYPFINPWRKECENFDKYAVIHNKCLDMEQMLCVDAVDVEQTGKEGKVEAKNKEKMIKLRYKSANADCGAVANTEETKQRKDLG